MGIEAGGKDLSGQELPPEPTAAAVGDEQIDVDDMMVAMIEDYSSVITHQFQNCTELLRSICIHLSQFAFSILHISYRRI